MSSATKIHPDEVLTVLLAEPRRSNVQRTLRALHELCRKHYELGDHNFALATIGRMAEEAGLFVSGILYNQSSRSYRELISAWGAYAGPLLLERKAKAPVSYDYLLQIQDPALRTVIQSVIAERDSLKAQVNILKSTQLGTIDRRQEGASTSLIAQGSTSEWMQMSTNLTDGERDALRHAISTEFLYGEGWEEGERGEIRKGRRTLFRNGFTTAIRKVLGGPGRQNVKVIQ